MDDSWEVRLEAAARVAVCAFAPFLACAFIPGGGWLVAMSAGYLSLPLIIIACMVAIAFVDRIATNPKAWAISALTLSMAYGGFWFDAGGAIAAAFFAIPSAILFLWWDRRRPILSARDPQDFA